VGNFSISIRIFSSLILLILFVAITFNIKFEIHFLSNEVKIRNIFFGVPYFAKSFNREEFKIALTNYPKLVSNERLKIRWENNAWTKNKEEWIAFYYDDKEIWSIGNKRNSKQIIAYLKEGVKQ